MKFGQYELLEQIAMGGMAEVFKGRVVAAEGFEKLVAIKRILPDLAEDDRFVKMLLTEARIHSALSHRNIVQIHDLGISEDGEYFIVLEFVEGYDLRVIMEQIHGAGEIIPEALSLHIAAEIAQALSFAHELRGQDGQPLGLIHRDVTPSNILLSFAGEVKLSDFGLAKRRHDRSVVGSLKGNLAYMSPEQANQAQLDRRTDIFSLGAILFELLTGKRLREITNEIAGWSQVASGVLPSARQVRPDLPAAVEHLLDSALAADPAKRFPDAATFGAAIRNVLGDLSVAVGASDLAALLGVIQPPRRARTLNTERSKVIRLGPEAQALREAIAAPATPAPILTAPARTLNLAPARTLNLADAGPTPPARSMTPARTPARKPTPGRTPARNMTPARTGATRATPPSPRHVPDPNVTPPPTTPLPPARARGYTPFKVSTSDPERTPIATPLPQPIDRRQATMHGRAGPGRPPADARDRPGPAGSQATMRGPAPTPTARRPSQPIPAGGSAPHASSPRAQPNGQRPAGQLGHGPAANQAVVPETPAYGVQRPPPKDFAVARTLMMEQGAGGGGGAAGPGPGRPGRISPPMMQPALPNRVHRETARVQFRPQRQWGRVFMVLLLLLAGAGVAVHLTFIPLDVLITWGQPTGLSIATDPAGAKLQLDGVPLAASAPTTVTVWRDRAEHVVEATRPGYQVAREKIRYDKSASLSFLLRLQPGASAPPAAAPEPAAPKP